MVRPEAQPVDLGEPLPGGRDAPGLPTPLSDQQLAFRSVLIQWDAERANPRQLTGAMYDGALSAWHGPKNNPERHAQTAHSLRELIEKLVFRPERSLGQQFSRLQRAWKAACRRSSCWSDGSWCGRIDGPLQALLQIVGSVVEWADADLAGWHTKIERWIAAYSAEGRGMAVADIQDDAHSIVQIRDVFVAVAHHGRPRKLTLEQAMESLARLLLRHLGP